MGAPRPHINPDTASRAEIAAAAAWLEGRRLDEVGTARGLLLPPSPQLKGLVGTVVEEYFGIPPNSRAEADFVRVGIELKTVPIQLSREGPRAKERISLGMIDYAALPRESWATAKVRRKLEQLLLVFYHWEPFRPIGYFKVLTARLWEPGPIEMQSIRKDWEAIRDMVADGRADRLSESLTMVLGAATKGPGHGSRSRAWSLKQPFVGWLYREIGGNDHERSPGTERLGSASARPPTPGKQAATGSEVAGLPSDPASAFEARVLATLRTVEGMTTGAVAARLGVAVSRAKSGDSQIVRRVLGQPDHGRVGDFERFGVELKTVPVSPSGVVVEAMSFPAFVHEELVYESWEDSDLLGRLNRLLIVPLRRERGTGSGHATIQPAFFWSPTEKELRGIREEWEAFRSLIRAGRSRSLPTASETRFIHVRPHGRRAADTELAPGGFDVTKKSFWLNERFVERVVSSGSRSHERR